MSQMIPTPHISANAGDFAKTVLMPGDPLRAKVIAETYLENAREVTAVRGMLGYTGSYKGRPVSVMGSGMGIPSMGIYSHELYHFYGVERIIRIGSAGAAIESVDVPDLLVAMGACTNSAFAYQFELPGQFAAIASWPLLKIAADTAQRLGTPVKIGNILSSDAFYETESLGKWAALGVLGVEMETAGLYMTAAKAGKQALAFLTVSDSPFSGKIMTAEERQNSFGQMMELALETAIQD